MHSLKMERMLGTADLEVLSPGRSLSVLRQITVTHLKENGASQIHGTHICTVSWWEKWRGRAKAVGSFCQTLARHGILGGLERMVVECGDMWGLAYSLQF